MLRKKAAVFAILFVFFVEPISLYANLHMRMFSEGVFSFIFSMFYSPTDRHRPVFQGVVVKGEPKIVEIDHRFKGKHDVSVTGPFIQDLSVYYELHIECDSDVAGAYKSSDTGTTDGTREINNEITLAIYTVENIDAARCQLNLHSDDIDEVYVKIAERLYL